MLKVGITGNIGSGKSLVEEILIEQNFKTICADKISKEIFENDKKVKEEIFNLFQTNDRKKIAEIVFEDFDKKNKLEKVIHSKVKQKIENFFEKNKNEKIVFAIVPLLFEANFEKMFDKIIFVSANKEIRLNRILKRNNYEIKHAKKRIESQLDESEKIYKCDFVIKNENTIEDTKQQIDNILSKLI